MMTKTKTPESLFPEITAQMKNLFGDGLLSLALYGSAATPDYRPEKSDINFLAVLSDEGKKALGRVLPLVGPWKKKGMAVPLFMTEREIRASLDVFPLEFLTMQKHHVPVFGNDLLGSLDFRKDHVRLQCERDLRGKLLLLRSGFLDSLGKAGDLRRLIGASMTAFVSIFQGILFLRDRPIPDTRREIIAETARDLSLDGSIFFKCLEIREGTLRLSENETTEIFTRYLGAVEALAERMDRDGGL
ncbi:MAG TPA: hypothetical protein PKL99_00665 [Syntrophales bacterium]|nr:hypothetical protein [Syntrophales bacterium]